MLIESLENRIWIWTQSREVPLFPLPHSTFASRPRAAVTTQLSSSVWVSTDHPGLPAPSPELTLPFLASHNKDSGVREPSPLTYGNAWYFVLRWQMPFQLPSAWGWRGWEGVCSSWGGTWSSGSHLVHCWGANLDYQGSSGILLKNETWQGAQLAVTEMQPPHH